ncbi:hypothetical protein CN188_09555 [Sinorhizobium meliloti]|uniref:hypothetical protein n=1 Tax=Rhizobium meliloti TaxID=382 RepID=UPI000FD94B04|nr:hypothetical protein [Sinorhizobium meliloti]RVI83908.1 hypothetical protein CN188_09555 [Sinorhizobium meliloti]
MKKEHADALESGSILISTASYYRGLEDHWIGDELENRTVHPIDHYEATGDHRDLNRLGPMFKTEAGAKFSNISVVYEAVNCFVLCLSIGEIDAMAGRMLRREPDNYDACVEILNPGELFSAIYDTGATEDYGWFQDLVHAPQMGMVQYKNMVRLGHTPYEPPSPFDKGMDFEPQQELRAAYYSKRAALPDRLGINFEVPARTLRRIC